MPTPLLILSDAPTSGTGLGRITRDLAVRIHEHLSDVFTVATLGYGGPYSRKLGFHQYETNMRDWVIYNLPDVWKDFVGKERGILMTIWDASRLLWLARPENCDDGALKKFLTNAEMEKWGYFPMDATGPNDKLTAILRHTIEGFDRTLAYSKWAADIVEATIEAPVEQLPHGIDVSVFYPRHYRAARNGFGERLGARNRKAKWMTIPSDCLLIGIVATNQARKDFGVGIQAVAELAKNRNVFLWIHTDVLERHWSLPALMYDFGLDTEKTVVTCAQYTDEQMAWSYSACDVTLGIGNGEGFGLPIFESLACGTPCIHGDYGGAPEHMPEQMLVRPATRRIEGVYNCYRCVYDYLDWYSKLCMMPKKTGESLLPAHLDWNNLWPRWSEWLTKGVSECQSTSSPTSLSSTLNSRS